MKRISVVMVGMLCFLVGCSQQDKSVSDTSTTANSGVVQSAEQVKDTLTDIISEVLPADEGDGVVDGFSRTNEKGAGYTIFNCDGVILASEDGDISWHPLILNNVKGFEDVQDGEFAHCSLNTFVESGGIAGIHEITVKKVLSCGRCTLEEVKEAKGDLLNQYGFEYPYVNGLAVYEDYVVAFQIGEPYRIYKDGAFLDKYDTLEEVSAVLQGNSTEETTDVSELDKDTKALYSQQAEDAIKEVMESDEFQTADEENRISMMTDCLKTLYEKGYIENYSVADNDVIPYTDIYGLPNGVKVMPFEEGFN